MCGLQDILNFYTCHDNWSRCIGYFHRSNNRIGIGTAKEKRRPFECHPIVIGTVKVDLRQVTCLHEQDVGYMTIINSISSTTDEFMSFLSKYLYELDILRIDFHCRCQQHGQFYQEPFCFGTPCCH